MVIRFSTQACGTLDIMCWHYTYRNEAAGYAVRPSGFRQVFILSIVEGVDNNNLVTGRNGCAGTLSDVMRLHSRRTQVCAYAN